MRIFHRAVLGGGRNALASRFRGLLSLAGNIDSLSVPTSTIRFLVWEWTGISKPKPNEASPQTDEPCYLQPEQVASPTSPTHANASNLRHHEPADSAAFCYP